MMRKTFALAALLAATAFTPASAQEEPQERHMRRDDVARVEGDGRREGGWQRQQQEQAAPQGGGNAGGGWQRQQRAAAPAPVAQAAPVYQAPQVAVQPAAQPQWNGGQRGWNGGAAAETPRSGGWNRGGNGGQVDRGQAQPNPGWRGNAQPATPVAPPVADRRGPESGGGWTGQRDGRQWNGTTNGNADRRAEGQRDGRQWDGNRDGNRDGRDWRNNGNTGGNWNNDRGRNNGWQQQDRRWNNGQNYGQNYGQNWNRQQGNRQQWDNRNWNGQNWSRDWRRDQRYNWQTYRYSNRNLFRGDRYDAPYGWNYGYRRFSIGIYLNNLLFDQQYWIDDPYDYRLPPAYGPYRWVRYYDDVLLVDLRSGQVVDVIYDFFW